MTDLEIADAIRREYERWDAEDVASNPRPVLEKPSVAMLHSLALIAEDGDPEEIARLEEEIAQQQFVENEAAEVDAYGQSREERWAARRAEFLAELGVS